MLVGRVKPSGDPVEAHPPTSDPPRDFRSVQELVAKIDEFVENDHQNVRLLVGAATADSIFAQVQ